jgi:integrase
MPGKRLNGEGSVYQRASDGRWVGAVTIGYNEIGRPLRKTVSGKSAKEARRKLRSVLRQLDDGLPPPDDKMTVKQLLARWEKDILRHQVATNTFQNYKSLAEHHIEPMFGRKRVSKLMPADVDALVSAKLDEGYSVSTVRRIRDILSQALDQAIRLGGHAEECRSPDPRTTGQAKRGAGALA